MTSAVTRDGTRIWFDGDEPPSHWRCPHDRALVTLNRVEQHVARFHRECLSCNAESTLCRGLLDIGSIRPEDWHHQ